jgi:hypothetical protein
VSGDRVSEPLDGARADEHKQRPGDDLQHAVRCLEHKTDLECAVQDGRHARGGGLPPRPDASSGGRVDTEEGRNLGRGQHSTLGVLGDHSAIMAMPVAP